MFLPIGSTVSTPYGVGTITELNPSYGYKVRLKSGYESWWKFDYITEIRQV